MDAPSVQFAMASRSAIDGVLSFMKRLWIFAAALPLALSCDAAWPAGNAQAGATKSAVCQACHGANGNSTNPQWPRLAGLGEDYIVEQLDNFKSGKRKNVVMLPMASALSPEDMADIGAFFQAQTNTGGEVDPAHREAGEKLYRSGDKSRGIPACMACHDPTGRGNEPAKFPELRGQHSVYVTQQLNDYASGARPAGPGAIMETIAKRLSTDDIRDVAAYLQGMH